jgi:hypothetical protein
VVKLTAGLAAAGLGALIKSSRFRPFEQATSEGAEAGEGPIRVTDAHLATALDQLLDNRN